MQTNFSGHKLRLAMALMLAGPLMGCSSYCINGLPAIPAHRVPKQFLQTERKDDLQDLTLARLRQDPPPVYQLGPGDVLGMYIENVIGTEEELPPVHYPEDASAPPAVGVPVPIREDGTIMLPIVAPINVEGLSLVQATNVIRRAYTVDEQILREGNDQILCSLIRKRKTRVIVVREESGGEANVSKRGTGQTVDLPAYENDVLHALNETGGLPGLDAKNEVVILRSRFADGAKYDQMVAQIRSSKGACDIPPMEPADPNITVIPLRFPSTRPPQFREQDIILEEGDIVMIRSRDAETFFTGGVLAGQEIPLPRDKDLDIVNAIALAGGSIGASGAMLQANNGGGGGMGGGGGGQRGGIFPPSRAIVLRQLPNGGQLPIRVDLNRALADPGHRILIKPKDVIVVQYTIGEDIGNAVFGIVSFNFLFNGFGGSGF